jgi:hypothetical protein
MPRQVHHGEQQIADFLGNRIPWRLFLERRANTPPFLSAILSSTCAGSGQSNPTRAARFCSFTARVRAGRPPVTPSRALGFCPLAAAAAARLSALLALQAWVCSAASAIARSPKTCGGA